MAAEAGLRIAEVIYEGNPSRFIGSEQYERDIPLVDPRPVLSGSWRRWLGWWRSKRLGSRTDALNQAGGKGDWACFDLRQAAEHTQIFGGGPLKLDSAWATRVHEFDSASSPRDSNSHWSRGPHTVACCGDLADTALSRFDSGSV